MVPDLLVLTGAGVGICAVVAAFFWKVDEVISPDAKKAISKWLTRLDVPESVPKWPSQFVSLFDKAFGERHLSRRCFLRSAVASVAAVAIMSVVWATLRPNEFADFMSGWLSDTKNYFTLMLIVLALNIIPDYFSLLETRYVLRLLPHASSFKKRLVLLLADVIATIVIFFLGYVLLLIMATGISVIWLQESVASATARVWGSLKGTIDGEIIVAMLGLSADGKGAPSMGVFFYSTFFTSIWLWLYVVSGSLVRLGERIRPGLRVLKWFLDIKNHPVRSIGVVAGALSSIVYWSFALVVRVL